jgi:hypothetical protein
VDAAVLVVGVVVDVCPVVVIGDVVVEVVGLVVVVPGAVTVTVTEVVTVVVCWRFFFPGFPFWSAARAAAKGSGDELVVIWARPTPASAANARPTMAATTEPRVRGFDGLGTGVSFVEARG